MACHIGHVLVADDDNLRGMVCQEDAQQTVDEALTAHLHQRFEASTPSARRREPSPAAMIANFTCLSLTFNVFYNPDAKIGKYWE